MADPYTAKNTSKNYEKGEVYLKDATMTAEKFRKMMTGLVFKSIREKMPWADVVKVQMDGAPGHTGKETPKILNKAGKICRHGGPIIELITQPSNSPDLNVNDLGFFPSMSSRVSKIKTRKIEELVGQVNKCFADYDSETLERLWSLKTSVLAEIVKVQGNNNYKLPHRKKY